MSAEARPHKQPGPQARAGGKTVKATVNLDAELHKRWKLCATRNEETMTSFLERALRLEIRRRKSFRAEFG